MDYAAAFGDDPALHAKVAAALASQLPASAILPDITAHVLFLKRQLAAAIATAAAAAAASSSTLPATKRRADDDDDVGRAPIGPTNGAKRPKRDHYTTTDGAWTAAPASAAARDISFVAPVRKKLTLELVDGGGLRGVTAAGVAEVAIAWADVEQIIMVRVPDKATPAHHFTIIPRAATATTATNQAIVFTVTTTLPATLSGPAPASPATTFETHLRSLLDTHLRPHSRRVLVPSPSHFSSAARSHAHARQPPALHVVAHLGSRDGCLHFLPEGILWGFRKPVAWLARERIARVAYTGVLQRTFNLTVSVLRVGGDGRADAGDSGGDDDVDDVEFAMIDQAEHAGVDAYVRKHGLQDASLANERRAKVADGRGTRKELRQTREDGVDGEEDENELAKVERELQDAEDAEEEDFDPGSSGESDGSGESSEEDGEDGLLTVEAGEVDHLDELNSDSEDHAQADDD